MRLVVLDRDGVINQDSDEYIKCPEEWEPIPGSLEAIARLCRADYRVVIATNQSGVGRGLFSMDMLNKIHNRMLEHIHQKGGAIDAILVCPCHPDANCRCRKPKPGMLVDLAERLKINLTAVPMVGDSLRDLEAARAVHGLPVLVRTGKGERTARELGQRADREFAEIPIYPDLAAFSGALLQGELDQRMEALRSP